MDKDDLFEATSPTNPTPIPEPTSSTNVVVGKLDDTNRNDLPKPCECRWCVAAERRDRMEMGGMVIAPCDEYGRTDREAMPSLTGEQWDALDTARSCLLERHWEVAEAIEKAFPEAFNPEPKFEWAEDQVVLVKFRKYSGDGWSFAIRTADGGFTCDDAAGFSADGLADLYEVRRLLPETRADLLGAMRGEQA